MIPTPIDAVPLLTHRQRSELLLVPEPKRRLAAWLFLVRDDTSGIWTQRLAPCPSCVVDGVPCIVSRLPGWGAACVRCYHCEVSACCANQDGGGEPVPMARYDSGLAPLQNDSGSISTPTSWVAQPAPGWEYPKTYLAAGVSVPPPQPQAREPPSSSRPTHGAAPSARPPRYIDFSSMPYDGKIADEILAQARSTADPRVSLLAKGEYTERRGAVMSVRVLPPPRSGTSSAGGGWGKTSWLVLAFDTAEAAQGQPRRGVVYYGGRAHAKVQRRAATHANYAHAPHVAAAPFFAASFLAVPCAPLAGPQGGVHAVALALWLSRAPEKEEPALFFAADDQLARAEHARILAGEEPPLLALCIQRVYLGQVQSWGALPCV